MGDVDLWAVTDNHDSLTVNSKWLQHLTERLLGEDGHPRKVKAGEDPHSNGLVLEWVYGTIVSTAEKARDGAKRPLGQYLPAAGDAHLALVRALEEQSLWDSRLQECRQLLSDLLKTRLEAQQLAKQYDIKPVPKNTKVRGDGTELKRVLLVRTPMHCVCGWLIHPVSVLKVYFACLWSRCLYQHARTRAWFVHFQASYFTGKVV